MILNPEAVAQIIALFEGGAAFAAAQFMTTLVPRTSRRAVAILFALLGLAFFVLAVDTSPSAYAIGFMIGCMVASARLLIGMRFL